METTVRTELRDRFITRLYILSLVIGFSMFFLLILSKEFFPLSLLLGYVNSYLLPPELVWEDFSIVDVFFISGFAFSIVSATLLTGFQAWTKDEVEYYDWLVSLGIRRWTVKAVQSYVPKSVYHTSARLGPIILLMFLCLTSLLLVIYLLFVVTPS